MKDSRRCLLAVTSCGGWCGALAFLAVLLLNVARGAELPSFVLRALTALGLGYIAGCVFGLIGFAIVNESLSEEPNPAVTDEPPVAEEPPAKPARSRKG